MQLSEKAIYSAGLRWWKEKKEPLNDTESKFGNDIEVSVNTSNLNTSEETEDDLQTKKFKIQLPHKTWKTIEPVELNYVRKDTVRGVRKYVVLKPGVWTNVIVDAIAKRKDIPCAWVFKNNKCYFDSIKFQATCVTCSANLLGNMHEIPMDNEPATINIEILGLNSRRHEIIKNKSVKIVGENL